MTGCHCKLDTSYKKLKECITRGNCLTSRMSSPSLTHTHTHTSHLLLNALPWKSCSNRLVSIKNILYRSSRNNTTTLKIILYTVKNFSHGAPSSDIDLNNAIIRKSRNSIFNIHLAFIHQLKIQTYYVDTSTGTTLHHRTSLLPEFHNTSAIQPRRIQDR